MFDQLVLLSGIVGSGLLVWPVVTAEGNASAESLWTTITLGGHLGAVLIAVFAEVAFYSNSRPKEIEQGDDLEDAETELDSLLLL